MKYIQLDTNFSPDFFPGPTPTELAEENRKRWAAPITFDANHVLRNDMANDQISQM
jgi:hypothetical protein